MRWSKPSYDERKKQWEADMQAARDAHMARVLALQEWHPIFAWRPHSTVDGACKMWLEHILCRWHHNENSGRHEWQYRPITILEKDVKPYGD
jgi:hypothetical protein